MDGDGWGLAVELADVHFHADYEPNGTSHHHHEYKPELE